jgi:hypothetical protein
VIHAGTADFCSACKEFITGMDETERVMSGMLSINKQVNHAILELGFIVSARTSSLLDNARLLKSSAAASKPSHAPGKARPNRRWPCSTCSKWSTVTRTSSMK